MHAEVYGKLRQHYHQHPLGFPETENGVEMEILERLFNEEEARTALQLTPQAETVEDLSARVGKDATEMFSLLERMVDKGVIVRIGEKGKGRYRLVPFVPGIYELQLKSLDQEMVRKLEDFFPALAKEIFGARTPWSRVTPVEKSLPVDVEIYPYERASQIIQQASKIALADCICRTERNLAGKGCAKPKDEMCLVFAPMADQYIEKGLGRAATEQDALKSIKRGEQAGLVRCSLNVQRRVTFMCQCCSCCCAFLRGLRELDLPNAVAKANFTCAVEKESCTGCEACVTICPMDALSLKDDKAVLAIARCIGCGLCVQECPAGSLSLRRKEEKGITAPPLSFTELMTAIGQDKGRTYFYPRIA